MTARLGTRVRPIEINRRSKIEKAIARMLEAAAILSLDAWVFMVTLGALHSWQSRIPAVPFWPVLGVLYLFSSLIGLAVWSAIRGAQTWLDTS